jgi:uncharacterized protein (DUF427 family)
VARAIGSGAVLAQSDDTGIVEGNHDSPPESVNREFFEPSDKHTVCPWNGTASYHDAVVDGARNIAAAWYYPDPKAAAAQIRDYVAFWSGVQIENRTPDH